MFLDRVPKQRSVFFDSWGVCPWDIPAYCVNSCGVSWQWKCHVCKTPWQHVQKVLPHKGWQQDVWIISVSARYFEVKLLGFGLDLSWPCGLSTPDNHTQIKPCGSCPPPTFYPPPRWQLNHFFLTESWLLQVFDVVDGATRTWGTDHSGSFSGSYIMTMMSGQGCQSEEAASLVVKRN